MMTLNRKACRGALAMVCAALFAAAPVWALLDAKLQQVDAVVRQNLDLQARYWAWRVAEVKDVSFEQLDSNSRRWIMSPETREDLFRKIKGILESGEVQPLTPEERRRHEDSQRTIRGILGAQATASEAKFSDGRTERIDRIQRTTLDLEARYWAWRVARVRDATYEELLEKSNRWIIKPGTRDELFRGIRRLLDSGEVEPLSAEEKRRYDESTNAIREILGTGPLGASKERRPVMEKADKIDRRILDLDALYWAWRIERIRDIAYDELHAKSESWIMKRETRDELFKKIRTHLDSGTVRELTPEERALLDKGKAEVRWLLR
ncbi:MAG: hypothetical protein HY922_15465 [Elusimicrobia bacterium]|nr:hypothetical protein [Elusimicrobiota bacterium]